MPVDSVYHLVNVDRRTKKNGEPYFMLTLSDASGTAGAIMWEGHGGLVTGAVSQDDFVRVGGEAGEYNNSLQLTLKKISRVDDSTVDISAFLPVSPRSRAEMEKELDAWLDRVTDKDCQRLLERLLKHARIRELYCCAPAAQRVHQAYIHGLLEHTLNVMKLAWSIADVYEPINRSLLITGTLLHDIGKIREMDWHRTITYTTEGRLMGHISIGSSMVDAVINELRRKEDFNRDLQMQILHMILSHHGKLEYGSPVVPKMREALVLHYADHCEAYMAAFTTEIGKAIDRGDTWTAYNKMFESYLYAGPQPGKTVPPGEAVPRFRIEEKGNPIEDISTIR